MKKVVKQVKAKKIGERHNIIEIIGLSFRNWWQNFIIVLPFVFNMVASGIGLLLLLLLFGLLFTAVFGSLFLKALQEFFYLSTLGGMDMIEVEQGLENMTNLTAFFSEPSVFVLLFVMVVIAVFLLGLIKAYFYSGAIAMSSEIVSGKKTNLRTMTIAGKKFLWRYWLVQLIITLGILVWFFLFSLPLILGGNVVWLLLPVLSLFPLIFIFIFFMLIFFMLAEYYVVLEGLGVWQAFARSVAVVKKNYWAMMGLDVLFFLMNVVVGTIPWFGGLASLLVVVPCQTLAFVIFAIERGKG